MKKYLITLTLLLISSVGGYFAYEAYQKKQERLGFIAAQKEGRAYAQSVFDLLKQKPYPTWEELEEKTLSLRTTYYVGIADKDHVTAKLCSDCHLRPDSFKILVYGNLDDDNEMDQFIVGSEFQIPQHLFDDLKEE